MFDFYCCAYNFICYWNDVGMMEVLKVVGIIGFSAAAIYFWKWG
jgi:hypothetical protein